MEDTSQAGIQPETAPGHFPTGPFSSPEWVQAIIARPEPVLRNLQITQSYHQFTLDFLRYLDGENLCWCAFATWASKQAGQFIRGEQAPPALLDLLGLGRDGRPAPRPWYWFLLPKWLLRSKKLLAYARCTVEDISGSIAAGNLRVYQKLAPIFADFLAMIHTHQQPQPAVLEGFLDRLAEDPTTHAEVLAAFRNYYLARFEPLPKARAERILLANILIGLHEQKRLQEAIEGALKAPIRQALEDPERRWSSLPLPMPVRRLCASLFGWALGPAIRRFEEKWQIAATRSLMSLATPAGPLRLGEDIPPLPNGEPYPEQLKEPSLPGLLSALSELDYTPNTTAGSGARDWVKLADRMNYIADLFRSRQQYLELAKAAFSPAQVLAIQAGQVPEGEL